MQIEELFDLTTWIEKELVGKQISQAYSALYSILHSNAQPNTAKQSFEAQKEALVIALKDIGLSLLSTGQLQILSELGLTEILGDEGVDSLEGLLFRNVLDIATTVQRIAEKIASLTTAIEWSHNMRTSLSKIIKVEDVTQLEDVALLRVHFQKEAHLNNLTEFKEWGKIWYEIGRGIAMAHNAAPEDFRVVGASKGSVIITLATTYGMVKTSCFIIHEVLKVIEKVYDIKKAAQEVRQLKIANDTAVLALEKAEEEERKLGKVAILTSVVEQLSLNSATDGEKITTLEKSIKQLVDFIEKGGEVDFIVPDEHAGEDAVEDDAFKMRAELRDSFKEVRKIERKLNLVEHKSS